MNNNSLSTVHLSIFSNNHHLVISVHYNNYFPEHYFSSFTINDLFLIHSDFKQYSTLHDIQSHLTHYINSNSENITLIKSNKTLLLSINNNTITFHLHSSLLTERTISSNSTFNINNTKDTLLKSILYTMHFLLIISLSLFIYFKLTNPFQLSIATYNDLQTISNWIDPNKQFTFSLLYRATRDGDLAKDFHDKCDYKGATLTLIKTIEGWIFGGYTDCVWASSNYKYEQCNDVFIFSLSLNKKYIASDSLNKFILNADVKGPTFGVGFDISICNRCLSEKSTCFSPSSFVGQDKMNEFNGGVKEFVVKEMEVYLVESKK